MARILTHGRTCSPETFVWSNSCLRQHFGKDLTHGWLASVRSSRTNWTSSRTPTVLREGRELQERLEVRKKRDSWWEMEWRVAKRGPEERQREREIEIEESGERKEKENLPPLQGLARIILPRGKARARLKANKKPIRISDRNGQNVQVEESGTRRGTHTEMGCGSPGVTRPQRECGTEVPHRIRDRPRSREPELQSTARSQRWAPEGQGPTRLQREPGNKSHS
ncbi:hypothetical protein BSL78_28307 [Apostichopus japonicus]|uniref:Uncharacterized protein n=1 Tax=Stichopus japonicus TaxID=307972 RepID=A0A2G8JGL7_STIJA|nr:hypothetical protein BSL78_28307 [Apostichopus japonicus]